MFLPAFIVSTQSISIASSGSQEVCLQVGHMICLVMKGGVFVC